MVVRAAGFRLFFGRCGRLALASLWLARLRIPVLATAARRRTGRGAMVGGIKPRTPEDNPHRGDDFLQRFFVAFRTACERLVVKFLVPVELDPAALTSIRINWHGFPLAWLTGGLYSIWQGTASLASHSHGMQKTLINTRVTKLQF
jgi:hypothetical protein